VDGHDIEEIVRVMNETTENKPCLILADTIKGRGVSFMEGDPDWHAKWLGNGDLDQALEELSE
jgi:transketolase